MGLPVTSKPRSSRPSRRNVAAAPGAAHACAGAIKHVLACVDGTDNDRAVLEHALQVAQRFVSHVDVLHVRFDAQGASLGPQHVRRADPLLGAAAESAAAEAATRARQNFEEWQGQSGLPLRDSGTAVCRPSVVWREIVGYESDVIARIGRVSDLIVVARPDERSPSFSIMALETALFETGRPVLMVPGSTAANLFHRPLIAWNGSCEAARAIGFALPFLAELDGCVEVFTAPEAKHQAEAQELIRHLSWHGIVAERVSADAAREVGASLLAHGQVSRAGLIVMGAYTHGHYRQFLFGGVTRHVMQHAATAVLLAH
jgi:nucleotide-binding universal stress UspA family protein